MEDFRIAFNKLKAKKQGEEEKKWILVNIQETSEFDCHRLNRDTWSDKNLKQFISNNFIFWQRYSNSEDAVRYKTFYLSTSGTMFSFSSYLQINQCHILE